MSSSNSVVLSYNDTLLRESDVDLLRGPHWLNDTIISFYFEYLDNDCFQKNPKLLFVSPDLTQCIKIMPSQEMGQFLDPLLSANSQFIFFALNDNQSPEISGGSHWSLLVFSIAEQMVFHFDSSEGSNKFQAYNLAKKLLQFFSMPLNGKYTEAMCLQQSNSYDCGVHVLCNAEQVANFCVKYGRIQGCTKLSQILAHSKRQEMLNIINELKIYHR